MRNPSDAHVHIKKTDTIELVDEYNPDKTKLIISGEDQNEVGLDLLFEVDNEIVGILIAKLNKAKWSRMRAKLKRAMDK